jgi:hypothetical protein
MDAWRFTPIPAFPLGRGKENSVERVKENSVEGASVERGKENRVGRGKGEQQ